MSAARGLCCAEPAWKECGFGAHVCDSAIRVVDHALFDDAPCSVHGLSSRPAHLLAQYRPCGRIALLPLELRERARSCNGRYSARGSRTIQCRTLIGQALSAFGALLCIVSTYWSIVFIVLVQLNYAIAPRICAVRCNFRNVSLVTCVTARKQIPFTLEWRKGTMSVRVLNIISNRKEG